MVTEVENVEKRSLKPDLKKLFWIFLIGSILGAYWEEILHIVRYYRRYGIFDYSPRRGVFWGPFSPVYGAGAVLLCLVLVGKKDKVEITFLKSAVLGGVLEYVISYLQELVIGTTSWNYSNKILSINGRTTIPYMLFWGLLGVIFLKFVYPLIDKFISSIPKRLYDYSTKFLVILLALDMLISWTALGRQAMRVRGIGPYTAIGEAYDVYFDDEYIEQKFPNMVRSK